MRLSRLIIHTPEDFRFRSTLLSHGWLQLKPFEYSDDFTTLYRTQQLSDGTVVRLVISAGADESLAVSVEGSALSEEQVQEVRDVVGRIFHLDLDLRSFYRRIEGRSPYEWVEAHGAGRLLRSPTVWEDLAKTLLTTNTTWSMTRAMVARLTALGESFGEDEHAFPSAERIAAMDPDSLADQVRAGYRNAYLHELACAIGEGRVDVEAWYDEPLPSDELFRQIRKLKGFGPYAAGSVLKLLGHYDELAIDSAARAMFRQKLSEADELKDAQIEAHYYEFGEWKGLVLWMDLMRGWFLEQKTPE